MGVQLDDGGTLMLFEFFDDTGRERALRGSYLSPQGQRRTVTARVRPLHLWRSGKTGVRYPVDHEVEVPALHLSIRTHADVRDQEMHSVFFNYWEGACSVTGTCRRTPISGKAYVEVTGHDMQEPTAVARRLSGAR
jgi:predicted secreted hydrolase